MCTQSTTVHLLIAHSHAVDRRFHESALPAALLVALRHLLGHAHTAHADWDAQLTERLNSLLDTRLQTAQLALLATTDSHVRHGHAGLRNESELEYSQGIIAGFAYAL